MNCTKCNYVSPVTGIELVKGAHMELIDIKPRGIYIYKKYRCTKCNAIKEITK